MPPAERSTSPDYEAAAVAIARLGLSADLPERESRNLARSLPRNYSPSGVGEVTPTPLSRSVARASSQASPLRKAWRHSQAKPQNAAELKICAKLGDAIKRLQDRGFDSNVGLAESVPLRTTRRTTLLVDLREEMDLLDMAIKSLDASRSEALFDLMAELLVLTFKHAWDRAGPRPQAATVADLARCLRLCTSTALKPPLRQPLLRHGVLPLVFAVLEAVKWPWDCGARSESERSRAAECCCATVIDLVAEEEFANFMAAAAPAVFIELLGASPEVASSAARVCKSMAVHEHLCESLVRLGAVPKLVRALDAAGPSALREQATRALGNIATHDHDHEIVAAGGVQSLAVMLDFELPMSMVTAALGALCNQAESPAMREAFVHAEGVARLVPFLTDEAPAAWVAGGGAEAMEGDERGEGPSAPPPVYEEEEEEEELDPLSLALDRGGHRAGGGSPTMLLGRLSQEKVRREFVQLRQQAGWILVSVATDPELAPAVVAGGGMRAIVAYAAGDDDEQKEEGAWALANLSSEPANAPSIVEAGGLRVLLGLLDSSSGAVRLQAVWALANLASVDHSKLQLLELGAVQRLVQWMRDGTREEAAADGASLLQVTRCLANLLVLGGCREQLLGCGGLRALLRVAEAVSALGGDEGGGGAHEGAPPPPEADDTLSAVARALANLTYDEQMAGEAVRAGVLAPLVAMLKREDAHHLQQEALMAIVNITAANAADDCRHEETLVACGVLEPLVILMECEYDHTVQEQATLALGNIASGDSQLDTQQRVLELGVLDTLARLRRSSIPKLARAAAGTLEALVHSLTPASRRALNADPVATVRAERRARPRRSSPLVTSRPQGPAA